MRKTLFRWLLPAFFAVAVVAVQAQRRVPPTGPADPLDARATVPALVYQSTLGTYRRLGGDKPVPWREANATVGRIGGWRAYAREAAEAAPPEVALRPSPPATAPTRPTPAPQGDPKRH
jgi:hypothetical protein